MILVEELIIFLDSLLQPNLFSDYCPNGLQVSGKTKIEKLITGVTANQALIDSAIEQQADAILVHHGFFWKGENPCVTGIKQRRLKKLLQHDINLIAYHLPLDAHEKWGNNVQLAKQLGIKIKGQFDINGAPNLGLVGQLAKVFTADDFTNHIAQVLQRKPLHINGGPAEIQQIAWCTGAAPDAIDQAIDLGVDAYITGEIAERTVSIAREAGIHFYAAGHHATERYGVAALGDYLAAKFNLQHQFIDIPNPV